MESGANAPRARRSPKKMKEFIRVRDDLHRNGMKMIPYFSPYYYYSELAKRRKKLHR